MKGDFILSFFFIILGLIGLLPLLLISFSNGQGSILEQIVAGLREYDGVVLSIGTIALISGLTLFSTRTVAKSQEVSTEISNSSQEKISELNRESQLITGQVQLKIAKEIKLAEFRQAWIDDMRADLAEYASLMATLQEDRDLQYDTRLSARIFLRLNHEEELSLKLGRAIVSNEKLRKSHSTYSPEELKRAIEETVKDFTHCGQEILRQEWTRLKLDLDEAMKFSGGDQ